MAASATPGEGEGLLRFVRLSANAVPPYRASPGAVGYDLYAAHDAVVPAGGQALVLTDLALLFPAGTYGRLAPRSGLAQRAAVTVDAGVIDPDYRGNVGVLLVNRNTDAEFPVRRGDRIAQLICERATFPHLVEETSLPASERGAAGFGSSGSR
nr:E4 protein [Lemur mastadenovirus]